jgi:NADH-quinone oxidoreductase subunit C
MLIEKLAARFGDAILRTETAHNEETIVVARDRGIEVLRALRDEPGFRFNFLSDLTALDWLGRAPRFEVVYHLYSFELKHRLRVKVPLDEADPSLPSVIELWKAADWLERECFDMFGIRFEGHPDLRRILMYDSFVGHPLRKDYPVNKRQPIVPEIDPVTSPRMPSR